MFQRSCETCSDVDATVTNDDMRASAQIALAFEEVVARRDISAFGLPIGGAGRIRDPASRSVSSRGQRLTALGRPGVTEGDVSRDGHEGRRPSGAGGMFVEFFSMDFDQNFILFGHDGPANINMAEGKAKLQHLAVHHGKTGHGLGIDFRVPNGPVTLLNLTQFAGRLHV